MIDPLRSRNLVYGAAAALMAACLVTASGVPLFDPDEGYYPATALESMTTGSAWDPRLDDARRWDKPILSYALIEAAFWAFGPSTTASRLPSAIQGALLVVAVGLIVGRLHGPRAGGLSATVLASTVGLHVFARAAHPEIAVVFAITITELLFCLWWVETSPRHTRVIAILAGVSIGYGVLAKGPVALVLPALMIACALPFLPAPRPSARRAATAVVLAGAIAFLLAAPWYAAMTVRHGYAFLAESLWKHNVVRYATPEFGHRGSVLFFVLPTLVLLFPWSGFLLGLRRAPATEIPAAARVLRTCMWAAAASAFVFYSLSVSKLVNYALAIVPPLAILVGLQLDRLLDAERQSRTAAEIAAGVCVLATGLALLAVPPAVSRGLNPRVLLGGAPIHGAEVVALLWPVVALPSAVLLFGGTASIAPRRRPVRLAALTLTGFVAPLVLLLTAQPLLDSTYPWRAFGDRIRRSGAASVWVYTYRIPSLTFYGQRPVHLITESAQLTSLLEGCEEAWLVIDRATWDENPHDDRVATIADARGRMLLVHVMPDM